jgi:hypothetical protein
MKNEEIILGVTVGAIEGRLRREGIDPGSMTEQEVAESHLSASDPAAVLDEIAAILRHSDSAWDEVSAAIAEKVIATGRDLS